ncbi:MAG TPA: hypothetical protein VKV21_13725 [Solirubrobacteraceae bacterium]|nr:hypothetical protein [Solirubrobacteraceae bacterium]
MAPITTRLRRLAGELSYAQRRSFELRTGIPYPESARSRRGRREVSELNALWDGAPRH